MANMYIKPTDYHQYLDYSSFFPKHTKYLIIYCQFLRARKISSSKSDFLKHCTTERFFQRGYSENMIDEEMNKVKVFEKGSK